MDGNTAHMLNDLTCDFYRREADSFAQTRQREWSGWTQLISEIHDVCAPGMSVLDIGCGNLRFERFLQKSLDMSSAEMTVYGIENCSEIVCAASEGVRADVYIKNVDLIGSLLDNEDLEGTLGGCMFDLSVAFGFFHHIPGFQYRARLLQTMVDLTKPSGYIAVSFWQFLNSDKLRVKADETTDCASRKTGIGALDENDYLLGWQHDDNVYRYCHHSDEKEIDALVDAAGSQTDEIVRFSADGKTEDLNRYLVLRKRQDLRP